MKTAKPAWDILPPSTYSALFHTSATLFWVSGFVFDDDVFAGGESSSLALAFLLEAGSSLAFLDAALDAVLAFRFGAIVHSGDGDERKQAPRARSPCWLCR